MRSKADLEKEKLRQLTELEKLVEENQFVAHANSILETEEVTDKVRNNYKLLSDCQHNSQ